MSWQILGSQKSLSARPTANRLCCTNGFEDSLHESRMIAGRHELLVPHKVQDQKLAFVQHRAEAARITFDLV